MALVRKYGKPEYFITFTCNSHWPEIMNNLEEGQRPEDRPDIVNRVFRLKLKELTDDIMKKKIFGEVVAHTYVIEYQKRGLPHAHILIIVRPEDKLKTAEDIDDLIWARLPRREDFVDGPIGDEPYERLRKTVESFMVHGPCKNMPCMEGMNKNSKTCGKVIFLYFYLILYIYNLVYFFKYIYF